jgi:hypothetical protein
MQDHEETCGTCGGRRDEPGMMSDDSYSQFPCPHPFHRQASPSRDGSVAAYERANERLEVALLHIINRISTEGRDDEHKHLFLVGSEAVKHATWRDVVAWLRRCRTAFHEDGLRWADLIEREFSPASTGDEEERAQNG